MTELIVPVLLLAVAAYCTYRKTDFYHAMLTGAADGLQVIRSILPPLIALLSAVAMLRASGALDALARLLTPLLTLLGIPPETAALIFLRPFSGSGALAVGSEIMKSAGPDSRLGRTAAVMLGSTETTFYVISVYFGSQKIKKTRHAVPAALAADLTGFIMAALTVRLFFR